MKYGGFNVIWGNLFATNIQLRYLSNHSIIQKGQSEFTVLPSRGIFGLANNLLGDEYIKVILRL